MNWMSGGEDSLIPMFNLSVTRKDIKTLQWSPATWLNDVVINFYLELLADRSNLNGKLLKVCAMNTFFLKQLIENRYAGVRRWTRRVDIFAHGTILIHWHLNILITLTNLVLKDDVDDMYHRER